MATAMNRWICIHNHPKIVKECPHRELDEQTDKAKCNEGNSCKIYGYYRFPENKDGGK